MKRIFLYITILLLPTLIFADKNFENFLHKMHELSERYKDKNNSNNLAKKIQRDFKIPTKEYLLKKNKKILDAFTKRSNKIKISALNMEDNNTTSKDLNISKTYKKVDTIFYLFSTSQSEYVFYNFVRDASVLKSVNKDVKYYGVVQGLLSQENLKEIYTPFKYSSIPQEDAIIKMQFMIFKDLDIKRVPAYLFSKCPVSFKYKECDNKYLVRGEISLQKALEIVSKEDKYYKKYLKILEEGTE